MTQIDQILARIFPNEPLVLIITSLLLLSLSEIGFRLGRYRSGGDVNAETQIGAIQASFLGLLALLLGFTFSMALGRFDARRELVLREANAIGTTYLRASFLPAQHQEAVEGLLRHYLDLRLPFYDPRLSFQALDSYEAQSAQVQSELWAQAAAAGREAPGPLIVAFANSLNETIDLSAARLHALRSHVPGAAWLLLLVVSSVACYISGYATGVSRSRSAFSILLLPILIAVVFTLITDLDAPRRGIIGISRQPLLDLQKSLQSTSR